MSVTPRVGIGYRDPIGDWICAHLDRFDVLEVTVEHYLYGGTRQRAALEAFAAGSERARVLVVLSDGEDPERRREVGTAELARAELMLRAQGLARAYLEPALRARPGDVALTRLLAQIHLEDGRPDLARAALDAAARDHPEDSEAWAEARAWLERAAERRPRRR